MSRVVNQAKSVLVFDHTSIVTSAVNNNLVNKFRNRIFVISIKNNFALKYNKNLGKYSK